MCIRWAVVLAAALVAGRVTAAQPPEVDSMSWLAGCWSMTRQAGFIEEFWLPPAGGAMLGLSRTIKNGRMSAHELMAIREREGRLAFVAHPSGQAEAAFPLVAWSATELTFENPEHDFPQRIVYRKTNDGIAARIEGSMSGSLRAVDFTYRRCAGGAAEIASGESSQAHATAAPRLGGSAEQRAAFLTYTQAFSNAQYERFAAFYTEDVVLELNTLPPIRGRQGIVDFYAQLFPSVRENLEIHRITADDGGIAGHFTSVFTAIEDAPDFVVMPLRKGEAVRVPVFVHYELRGGLIARIKVVRAGPPEKLAAP